MGHGDGGLGNPWLYFDAASGSFVSAQIPGTGSAGDIFMQAQFPLHSGRILGFTGRVMMSVFGVFIALVSVTGVLIYARKRRARTTARTQLPTPSITLQPQDFPADHQSQPLLAEPSPRRRKTAAAEIS
jgi:uncharacterized iron-regulated membrane protein